MKISTLRVYGSLVKTPPKSYSTTFSLTENPITEGGIWTGGLDEGQVWTDVETSGGLALATQDPGVAAPPYDDSLACLSGFPPNHYASAVLFSNSPTGVHENELLLRWKITPNFTRGYEVSIAATGEINIIRWNGPLNDWTILGNPTASSVADGDTWYAEIIGNIITVKRNGGVVVIYDISGDPTIWSDGDPGIGFFVKGATSAVNTFAWTSFLAQGFRQ
jgi:hypothetical protein